jgi:hypothetical protein
LAGAEVPLLESEAVTIAPTAKLRNSRLLQRTKEQFEQPFISPHSLHPRCVFSKRLSMNYAALQRKSWTKECIFAVTNPNAKRTFNGVVFQANAIDEGDDSAVIQLH